MIQFQPATASSILDEYPEDWPPRDFFVSQHRVTENQYRDLKALIENRGSESDVEAFLAANPSALALVLGFFHTGHHASWIIPKQTIRAHLGNNTPGLIPDYLVAGASSDGLTWCVLELKGPDAEIFSRSGSPKAFSSEANRGILQLLEYIDVCAENQAYLRDQAGLRGLREPRGLLMIGTDQELADIRNRRLKAAWNRLSSQLQIRTYSALLQELELKLRSLRLASND